MYNMEHYVAPRFPATSANPRAAPPPQWATRIGARGSQLPSTPSLTLRSTPESANPMQPPSQYTNPSSSPLRSPAPNGAFPYPAYSAPPEERRTPAASPDPAPTPFSTNTFASTLLSTVLLGAAANVLQPGDPNFRPGPTANNGRSAAPQSGFRVEVNTGVQQGTPSTEIIGLPTQYPDRAPASFRPSSGAQASGGQSIVVEGDGNGQTVTVQDDSRSITVRNGGGVTAPSPERDLLILNPACAEPELGYWWRWWCRVLVLDPRDPFLQFRPEFYIPGPLPP